MNVELAYRDDEEEAEGEEIGLADDVLDEITEVLLPEELEVDDDLTSDDDGEDDDEIGFDSDEEESLL